MRVIAQSGKRIAVFVIGAALVAGGIALLVLPGPGLLVIIAGLAVSFWKELTSDRRKAEQARTGRRPTPGNGADPDDEALDSTATPAGPVR